VRASVLKQLSIIAGAAAVVAAPIAMVARPGETQQGAAHATETSAVAPIQVVAAHPNYDAGMRIIHVPDAVAAYPRRSHRELQVETASPPNARPQQLAMPKPPQPRRILPPAATEQKRTVLSVPPPPPNSLTPIRPTPRWRSIEKFTMPPEAKPRPPIEPPRSSDVGVPGSTVTAASRSASEAVEPLPAVTETAAAPSPTGPPEIDDDSPPPAD
jgi:hypothetical protein